MRRRVGSVYRLLGGHDSLNAIVMSPRVGRGVRARHPVAVTGLAGIDAVTIVSMNSLHLQDANASTVRGVALFVVAVVGDFMSLSRGIFRPPRSLGRGIGTGVTTS